MPRGYQDGAARAHGFRTPDRTCQRGIRTGKEYHIVQDYEAVGRSFSIARVRNITSYMITKHQDGAEGRIWDLILSVPDHCLSFYFRISRVSNIRSYMNKRYQDGAARSHG